MNVHFLILKSNTRIFINILIFFQEMLIDAHCHLDHVKFKDDLDSVIQRAKQAGVKIIITNGINPETNKAALELAQTFNDQEFKRDNILR